MKEGRKKKRGMTYITQSSNVAQCDVQNARRHFALSFQLPAFYQRHAINYFLELFQLVIVPHTVHLYFLTRDLKYKAMF